MGLFSHPWGGAPPFTSFSRKVALESEKDIDRTSGLSPSPGPGAPRREQDPAAALHKGCCLHAWPRPTPAWLRRLLPSLSPGSLPLSSSLPSSLSPFLAFSVTLALSRRLSVLLSPFPSHLLPLYGSCFLFIGLPPTVLPSIKLSSLFRLPTLTSSSIPSPEKGLRNSHRRRQKGVSSSRAARLWSFGQKVLIP